ncbi:YqeG family HAD IIIA-type phosphatase [Fructilactobacillus sp. Tb1]|uniref:YqeG family HAD IIIA-type phosphatase n=1 Tax=Fructilactobacillus sp. Tb1 TaxID=3422304 RepID=UPI003D276D76
MLDAFKPTWMVESLYHISPERLKKNGIDTILTDLDNTLIPWNNSIGTAQIVEWITFMKENGISVIVVSNNNPKRVSIAVEDLNIPFVAHALKPLNRGIKQTLKRFNLKPSQVVMVGDQLMTDVWAANNCHVKSIWVKPLVKTDMLPTRVNRFLESLVFKMLKKKYPDMNWKEDID